MNTIFRNAWAAVALTICTHAAAQVVFYQGENFGGRSFTASSEVRNLQNIGFNDRASSVVVSSGRWEVCDEVRFRGRCMVLRPGRYPSLAAMGLNEPVTSVRALSASARVEDSRFAPVPVAPSAGSGAAVITFYEREGFQGRVFNTERPVRDMERVGFNDRASSAVVIGDRWEVCDERQFSGRCVILRPGRYPSLTAMGMQDGISSVRTVSRSARIEDRRYAPEPLPAYDNRRRRNERTYEANVTSVRAVVGTSGQRCWIDKEQVPQDRSNVSIPGAIIGAVIGGVLGHQVGSGRGNDAATIGGAVAGGAVGSQAGRITGAQGQVQTRDVQRCENVPGQARPDYWDVTYEFRGQEHRVQMTTPPGPTVLVNERGEPRA
ncbi:MAG: beta/gamma crystallin-related protein [Pseudomonadota bacterium]